MAAHDIDELENEIEEPDLSIMNVREFGKFRKDDFEKAGYKQT